MQRLSLVIVALLGIVSGAVGSAYYFQKAPIKTDAAAVRTIVAEMLAADDAARAKSQMSIAQIDPKTLDPLIEKYLMSDPKILQRVNEALDQQTKTEQSAQDRTAIAQNADSIFNDPDKIVLGNPKGDVTLVELFDYNCSYCRGALPDLATLMTEDPKLRVILKEFPILTPGSVDAARVAVQVAKSGADYWAFHQAMFTSRGEVTADTALDEAKALGLDPETLRAGMQSTAVTGVIQKSFDLDKTLNITGTPTYIIGDAMIPGAVPIDQLRAAIANMRACGSTQCPTTQHASSALVPPVS